MQFVLFESRLKECLMQQRELIVKTQESASQKHIRNLEKEIFGLKEQKQHEARKFTREINSLRHAIDNQGELHSLGNR